MQKKIRILQVTRSLNFGGLEKLVSILATKIDKERFQPEVCCLQRKGVYADSIQKSGIPIHLLEDENSESKKGSYLAYKKLKTIIEVVKPDIVHSHNTHAFFDSTLATLLKSDIRLVHTDHARNFPDNLKYMVAEKLCSLRANRIVAVSDYSKNDLINFEKISPKKIDVIYNGIPAPEMRIDHSAAKKQLQLNGCFPILGTICRHTPQKALHFLIEGLPEILNQYPKARLVLVGNGQENQKLRDLARSLKVDKNVTFTGFQTNISLYLSAFDIFVLSSIWEGMPLGLIEAMSFGLPIVATNVGGVSEVVESGSSGYVVEPRNSAEISKAILKMLENNQLREFGVSSRKRFDEAFVESFMIQKYEDLYASL